MTLARLLAERPLTLLDFDGPVCAVFGGERSAPEGARQLVDFAWVNKIPIPDEAVAIRDPFDVLHAAARSGPASAALVEAAFRDAEVRAVATAPMTAGVRDLLTALRDSGHLVVIVSNNSEAAVCAFLDAHRLRDDVRAVVARTEPDPGLLKPHPHLLRKAILAVGGEPGGSVLIRDSTTDVEAAHRVGAAAIAYANKPGKERTLAVLSPEAMLDQLDDLTRALRGREA